jgi:hypothetical protein
MKYLNKFDTKSDYQQSASTLEIPNVAYITASTEVIYNATQPKAYVVFADQAVGRKCVSLYSSDGVGCTEEDLAAVTYLNPNDWKGTQSNPNPYTSFDELRYFTGITTIDRDCFGYCTSLTSVTIPESVTSIGVYAFYDSPLESITFMSATAPTFGLNVFHDQAATGNLTVPANGEGNYYDLAVSLGNGWTINGHAPVRYVAFEDPLVASKCATLYGDGTGCTMADLSAVTTMSASDWSGSNITSFDELDTFTGLTELPDSLFEGCSGLTSVNIPASVTDIKQNAFFGNDLQEVNIPDSVTQVWYSAFANNTGLTSVTIGSSVSGLSSYAFYNCPLESITFMSETPPTYRKDEATFHGQAATGDITVPSGSESNFYSLAQSLGSGWTVNGQTPS